VQPGKTRFARIWSKFGLSGAGLAFGTHPEIGGGVLFVVVLVGLWLEHGTSRWFAVSLKSIPSFVRWALLIFTLLRISVAWRIDSPLQGLLEGLLALGFVVAGQWIIVHGVRIFALWTLTGVCIAVILAVVPYLDSVLRVRNLEWGDPAGLASINATPNGWMLRSLVNNAWMNQQDVLQGAGTIVYMLELRSKRPLNLNMSIIHPGLKGGRVDGICAVRIEWTRCKLSASLPYRAMTLMLIGGYGTWNTSSPPLEARGSKVIVGQGPNLWDVLGLSLREDFSPRLQGLSFNSNAFAAHIATLTGFAFTMSSSISYIAVPMILTGIWLSGSRNGLLAWLVGTVLSVVVRSRRPGRNLLVLTLGVAALGFALWQSGWNVPSTLRPVNFDDANGREVVYRLALEAFQAEPIRGVGNLRVWMSERLSAQEVPTGFTRNDVATHAHNALLQVAGESGLVGLLSWAAVLALVVSTLWKRRDFSGLGLLFALAMLNVFDYFVFFVPVQAVFWFVAAGVRNLTLPLERSSGIVQASL
jgi:hypothetical protein